MRISKFNRLLSILTLAGILIVSVGAVGSHDAHADGSRGKSIVGSWIVAVTPDPDVVGVPPPFTDMITLIGDGTLINSDPVFRTGHGVWERVRHGKFSIKFIHLIYDDPDLLSGTSLTITAEIKVSKSGDTASGPFEAVFEHPDFGGEFFRFPGTAAFERITIDDGDNDDDGDDDD